MSAVDMLLGCNCIWGHIARMIISTYFFKVNNLSGHQSGSLETNTFCIRMVIWVVYLQKNVLIRHLCRCKNHLLTYCVIPTLKQSNVSPILSFSFHSFTFCRKVSQSLINISCGFYLQLSLNASIIFCQAMVF